jgi:kumamolisin
MALPSNYKSVSGTDHSHPQDHRVVKATATDSPVTATIIVRRRSAQPGDPKLRALDDFTAEARAPRKQLSRSDFLAAHGADPKELDQVAAFAKENGLEVVQSDPARRSVVVRGTAAAMNKAFAVELQDYASPRGAYRSHAGTVNLPGPVADVVEADGHGE